MTQCLKTGRAERPTLSVSSPLPHIVLLQPQIPPNTGNIIRLCANCGAQLHLIEPLGFVIDNKRMRRAGLDYHEFADLKVWAKIEDYRQAYPDRRWVAVETTGQQHHTGFQFQANDTLLFGSETKGLPESLLDSLPDDCILRVPMLANRRSLNLSNTVAIVVYEAWRQLGFVGAE